MAGAPDLSRGRVGRILAARFRRQPWWSRVLDRVIPGRQRRRQEEFKAGIRWLVAHPEVPVFYPDERSPR